MLLFFLTGAKRERENAAPHTRKKVAESATEYGSELPFVYTSVDRSPWETIRPESDAVAPDDEHDSNQAGQPTEHGAEWLLQRCQAHAENQVHHEPWCWHYDC